MATRGCTVTVPPPKVELLRRVGSEASKRCKSLVNRVLCSIFSSSRALYVALGGLGGRSGTLLWRPACLIQLDTKVPRYHPILLSI